MNLPAHTEAGVARAPAPWLLHGRGYISMLRFAPGSSEQDRFVPASLQGRRGHSRTAWMMFVDYSQSDVGPYHELLFIPGSFPFADGRRHLSISRIFVSTLASVVNGQNNWGIPKEVAQFEVRYGEQGLDRVRVTQDGALIAELDYRSYPLPLPFPGQLTPGSLRTLGQHRDGKTFIYTPSASGWIRPAQLKRMHSNPQLFADLSQARAPLSVAVSRFRMVFPVSRILDHY
ncbi:Acetoacetate decarboxylase (ADC) [Solimonas aquatica]|uniref:Acetoacetate decarboxylase (ADC) n=1 Tax=Solimonas aquatica TaxID=489703 RepID=A0A1H9KGH5_9GAMM|nr:acetoacetate decarboxylase family protein [Solimonas aquatica]SEQ97943.1 Acetoacetate decarboxylase (ADC) [Solimonas aquatica]